MAETLKTKMAETVKVSKRPIEEEPELLVRILGHDIPGSKNIYVGLTRIKGISWSIANATCIKLGLIRSKKVADLSKDEIHKIEAFIKEMPVPDFLKNRRFDPETGETTHYLGTDLEMKHEFDIKKMIKMRSYKGVRHAAGQPVRGQKTRSHFRSRKNKQAVGLKRKVKEVKETK